MRFFIAIIVAIAGYLIYRWNKGKERKKNEEADRLAWEAEERKQLFTFVTRELPNIRAAVTRFFSHLKNYDAGYFTNYV